MGVRQTGLRLLKLVLTARWSDAGFVRRFVLLTARRKRRHRGFRLASDDVRFFCAAFRLQVLSRRKIPTTAAILAAVPQPACLLLMRADRVRGLGSDSSRSCNPYQLNRRFKAVALRRVAALRELVKLGIWKHRLRADGLARQTNAILLAPAHE